MLKSMTCLMPMQADESMADSGIWKGALRSAEAEWRDKLGGFSGEILDSTDASSLGKADALPAVPSSAHLRARVGLLMGWASKEAAHECLRQTEQLSPGDLLDRAMNTRLDTAVEKGLPFVQRTAKPYMGPIEEKIKQGDWEKLRSSHLASSIQDSVFPQREAPPSGVPPSRDAGTWPAVTTTTYPFFRRLSERPQCNASSGAFCLSSLLPNNGTTDNVFEACVLDLSILDCPPGFHCPGGTSAPLACRRGARCPVGTSRPLACPKGHFCPVSAISFACPSSLDCPENTSIPTLCSPGRYCPDGFSRVCPRGHFCAPGSSRPEPCARLADCPAGVGIESWSRVARWGFGLGSLAWALLLRSLPGLMQGWPSAEAPRKTYKSMAVVVPVLLLLALWGLQLNLVSLPKGFSLETALGGSPHTQPLVFLALHAAVMCHGMLLSRRVAKARIRVAVDWLVCALVCVAFASAFGDSKYLVFLGNAWVVFLVLWVMIKQIGPWRFRTATLAAALLAVSVALVRLKAPELAKLLACALLLSLAKELAWQAIPAMRFAIRKKRVEIMQSGLGDAPIRPLINSLASTALQISNNPEAHPAVAARVAASAQASLAALESSGRGAAVSSDPEAAAAWGEFHRACAREARSGDQGEACTISYRLQGVSYRLDSKRKLLHDLSFTVPGGTRVAVMGASGSGKTTLLSVLSGRCGDGRFEGEMFLNGAQVQPGQMASLRPIMGYVPQDDVMHTALTARENIRFQAELRLQGGDEADEHSAESSSTGPEDGAKARSRAERIQARVDAIINGLGLAHVAHRAVGDGLSGGQRKRVSIGMEIAAKPRVLLLDEPSTGLDASTAQRILELVLRCAASEHCTLFSTIHQPRWSTLTLFDMLVLLAPGGHLCYAGPVLGVKSYFEEVMHIDFPLDENPADIIIDACTFDSARAMAVDGLWKQPPQCLRAVVFPTPEVVNSDCKSHWQLEEFGQMMAALWHVRDGAASSSQRKESMDGLEASACALHPQREARQFVMQALEVERPNIASAASNGHRGLARVLQRQYEPSRHWAQQVWVHLVRTILVTSRVLWPTVALNASLLSVVMFCTLWAVKGSGLGHVFLPTGLTLLLLCLAQSVAAQRVFAGEERQVAYREAAVCSLNQVLWSFVGKDLASLLEISIGTMCFTLTFWPNANTFASVFDVYAIGFACLYSIWGLNYIFSIVCPPSTAMLFAVAACFLSFLFSGLKPEAEVLVGALGGYGRLLLLVSPIRWSMSHFIFRHITGRGSTFFEPSLLDTGVKWLFEHRGYRLENIVDGKCPAATGSVIERWSNKDGLLCHSGQLFLLGILFRFIAAACLLLCSSAKTSGGQLPLGFSSRVGSGVLRDALFVLLTFFVLLQIVLLGETS